MATLESINELTLQISRVLKAPRDEVYKAWTDAKVVSQWFAPTNEFTTNVTELDVREGGRYRIEMHAPDGDTYTVTGEYVKVTPPERLVFTWAWEHSDDDAAMLITVELAARGNTTELALTHERLPSENSRDLHNEGWTGCLDRLVELMNG